MAICPSILAWKIPWTEAPGGRKESDTTERTHGPFKRNTEARHTGRSRRRPCGDAAGMRVMWPQAKEHWSHQKPGEPGHILH